MSPEHLRGEAVGPLSDVYSLGCMLFASLTGTPPFRRETTAATITAHLHGEPPRVSDMAAVPREFDDVLARALAKTPEDRYHSAGELGAAALAAAHVREQADTGSGAAAKSEGSLWADEARRAQAAPGAQPQAEPTSVAQSAVPGEAETVVRGEEQTVMRGEERTRLAQTRIRPLDAAVAGGGAAAAAADHERGHRRRRVLALTALAVVVLMAVAAALIALPGSGPRTPAGPLTGSEITGAVRRFATDYGHRDTGALSRLLAPNVTRVDPSSVQHGRSAVLSEYEHQFVTRPVPVAYRVSDLSVTPGWAGRAQANYTLIVEGGGTLPGAVVFGLQRAGDGRVQIALISTR